MRIRYFFVFIVSWMSFCMNVLGQQKFVLEIRQVFPQNKLEYGRAFDYPEDLNRTKSSQMQKLKGNANYRVDIKRPNKQDNHESIQHIKWIELVNGVKSYYKNETRPAESYLKATVWEGYKCDLYGKPVGIKKRKEFLYRVSLAQSGNEYETDFIEKDSALAQADHIYNKVFTVEHPVEVLVCKFSGNIMTVIDSLTNEKDYHAYLKQVEDKQVAAQTENKLQVMKQNICRFKAEMDSICLKKDNLKLKGIYNCQKVLKTTGSLIPDSVFFAEKLDSVYRSVLIDNILPYADKKKKKELKQPVIFMGDKTICQKTTLLSFTTNIIKILFEERDE